MAVSRMRRVNEVMREVIGSTISGELQDPRIGFVTVTAVDTSPDLRRSRVYVSVLGGENERAETMEALNHSTRLIQRRIAEQLHMKRTPSLDFIYDESIERADRVIRMLES